MRFIKKAVILFLTLSILTSYISTSLLTANAEGPMQGNGDGGEADAGGGGGDGAFFYSNTGWLVYIVEGNPNNPEEVPVQVSETLVFYTSGNRPGNIEKVTHTRFGKEISKSDWNTPRQSEWGAPLDYRNGRCIGRGGVVKDAMQVGQADEIMDKYFSQYNAAFDEKDYYLIFEPFFWMGIFTGLKYSGASYCGTAYGWAELYKRLDSALAQDLSMGDRWVNLYTHNNFPNAARLEYKMWGLQPYSDYLTNDQIMTSGNGFIAVWPDRIIEEPPEPPEEEIEPPVEEEDPPVVEVVSKKLYEIKNWSEEFDISQSIPSGEPVFNQFYADTFYGTATVLPSTKSKSYSARYTFNWTEYEHIEHSAEYDQYGKLIKPAWTETIEHPKSTTKTYSFVASTMYQYIEDVEIFQYDSLVVKNKAFEEYPNYDASLVEEYPVVTPQVIRYTGDGDYNASDIVHGYAQDSASHYYFPEVNLDRTISVSSSDAVIDAYESAKAQSRATVYNNSYSFNDKLVVNVTVGNQQKSYIFMDNTVVHGCTIGNYYKTSAASSVYQNGGAGIWLDSIKPLRVTEKTEIMIPPETDNNDYPTGIQAFYKNIVNTNDNLNATFYTGRYWYSYGDDIYDHLIDGATDNTEFDLEDYPNGDGYPIKVHTPIISPIMITDNYGVAQIAPDEQLIDVDGSAQFQLKLDSYYMVKFNQDKWISSIYGEDVEGYGESGTPSKYDKYVMKKEVRFPFDVYYEGTFYRAGNWIEVEAPDDYLQQWNDNISYVDYESNNHWQMMPIYIPTYADEGSGTVEARVYAYNTYGRYDGNHDSALTIEMNSDQTEYVAEYHVTDQLSGHIYGFAVTGVDDTDMYDYVDLDKELMDRIEYPLCPEYEEKLPGKLNRFGQEGHRYLLDGKIITTVEDYNLLPLRKGSNATAGTHTGDGRLWMGTGFGFTLKTIANLSGNNDYIEITPTYKIYGTDGSLMYTYKPTGSTQMYGDCVVMYKDTNDGDTLKIFGGSQDNIKKVCALGSDLFDGAYYTNNRTITNNGTTYRYGNWVDYTLQRWNMMHGLAGSSIRTEYDMMDVAYPCYTSSKITLDKNLRMLSGEYEQLFKNRRNEKTSMITYNDWNTDGTKDSGIYGSEERMFRDSMQTWFGYYCMPGILYVHDGSWSDLRNQDSFNLADDFYHEDEIGDIVINFDIIAYKNGVAHLSYGGIMNGGRVWEKEGYNTQGGKYDYGDVVTYDSQKRWSDKLQGYAVMIN